MSASKGRYPENNEPTEGAATPPMNFERREGEFELCDFRSNSRLDLGGIPLRLAAKRIPKINP